MEQKALLEWVLKTVLVGISTYGLAQLKTITEDIQRVSVTLAETRLELRYINTNNTTILSRLEAVEKRLQLLEKESKR